MSDTTGVNKVRRGTLFESVKLWAGCVLFLVAWSWNPALDARITDAEQAYLVQRVFEKSFVDFDSSHHCAYTVATTIADSGSVLERFSPFGDEQNQWQLLAVDGQIPNELQSTKYVPMMRQRVPNFVNIEYIDEQTLEFEAQDLDGIRFTFELEESFQNENIQSFLENSVVIDPVYARLKEVKSVSDEPFRVFPWLKINRYENTQTFTYQPDINALVLSSYSFQVNMISGHIELDRDIHMEFHTYECRESKLNDGDINLDQDSSNGSPTDDPERLFNEGINW